MGDTEHPAYVTITKGLGGYFAVLLTWNPEFGGFYEPYASGVSSGSSNTDPIVLKEAVDWADSEGIEFKISQG